VLVSTLLACALTMTATVSLAGLSQAAAVADEPDTETTGDTGDTGGSELFLVTLTGPGSSADRGGVTARAFRKSALAEQDTTLATVGAGAPVYRWTTALNGYAVRITAAQARDLARDPAVASVEPDSVSAYTLTPERIAASSAALVGLVGAVIGGLALARSASRTGSRSGRRGAIVALVLGPIGLVIGGVVVATADGGLGTGNGLGGGIVAMMVGLIGMALGGLALARSRRAA